MALLAWACAASDSSRGSVALQPIPEMPSDTNMSTCFIFTRATWSNPRARPCMSTKQPNMEIERWVIGRPWLLGPLPGQDECLCGRDACDHLRRQPSQQVAITRTSAASELSLDCPSPSHIHPSRHALPTKRGPAHGSRQAHRLGPAGDRPETYLPDDQRPRTQHRLLADRHLPCDRDFQPPDHLC